VARKKNLSTEVRAGDRVLDLACGNGRLLEAFLDKDIFYLGIDNSEELFFCFEKLSAAQIYCRRYV
jgi:cyclopropane fatty-acyl-phospholipid synthase-like methyltransferase